MLHGLAFGLQHAPLDVVQNLIAGFFSLSESHGLLLMGLAFISLGLVLRRLPGISARRAPQDAHTGGQ